MYMMYIRVAYANYQAAHSGSADVGYLLTDKETGLGKGTVGKPVNPPDLNLKPFYRRLISSGMHTLTPQVRAFKYYKNQWKCIAALRAFLTSSFAAFGGQWCAPKCVILLVLLVSYISQ